MYNSGSLHIWLAKSQTLFEARFKDTSNFSRLSVDISMIE